MPYGWSGNARWSLSPIRSWVTLHNINFVVNCDLNKKRVRPGRKRGRDEKRSHIFSIISWWTTFSGTSLRALGRRSEGVQWDAEL